MLKLYISNKIENLSLQFAQHIKGYSNCFASELVIMQTSGMERWLALEAAKYNRIFTNFNFIKPNSFINQLYQLAGIESDSLYNTENLKWIIYRFLEDDEFKKQFEQVALYYQTDDIKRLQLSVKIADLFDQYLLYRQDYIEAWNKGNLAKVTKQKDETNQQYRNKQERLDKHQKWQFWLWNKIKEELPNESYDKVQLRDLIIKKLKDKDFQQQIKRQYGRISLFGLSVITDYHIEIFHRLSEILDVNLFFLNPAPETYWYDIVSDKFVYYIEKKTGLGIDELKLHVGNELLSNYSALAKDTYNILFKSDDFVNAIDDTLTEEPNNNTLLSKIQNDIFNNLNIKRNPISLENLKDKSLMISSSYTPMREVEALYNQLLDFFDTDKNLEAKDVIVQVSDVDLYTPYIKAVFDNSPYQLPYTIADRSYSGGDTLVGVMEILLQLSQEDFTSEGVLQLLNSEFIRNKFEITNVELIREVVREANIRFGIKGYASDDTQYVSWMYGLERILLGYAIKGGDEFQLEHYSTYPLDIIEGSDAEELLQFKAFIDHLILNLNHRIHDRPLSEWKTFIEDTIDNLLAVNEKSETEVKYIQQHLLAIEQMNHWLEEPISFDVFQKSFLDALFSNPRGGNFITGGITFCSMIPMRSIPFKVTAMLGLNGDKFPRTDNPIAFNLIDIEYKRGDRNTKNNDKYLFLETILSARKHLYLSYIGNSTKDNSSYNPSLLIEELIAYIETGCSGISSNEKIQDYFIQKHPLHAFSQKYFDKSSTLFTYISEDNDKQKHEIEIKSQVENNEELKTLNLQDLISFFENPFQYYYNKKLQIYFRDDPSLLPESEIFETDKLLEYFIKTDLFKYKNNIEEYTKKAKKTGALPLANMAPIITNEAFSEIEEIRNQYHEYTDGKEAKSFHLDMKFGNITLKSSISPIYNKKYICTNVSGESSKAKYLLKAWLPHLVIMASQQKFDSIFIAKYYENPLVFEHNLINPEKAQEILGQLIQIYLEGHKRITAFMPQIGYNLAKSLKANKGNETKIEKNLESSFNKLHSLDTPDYTTGIYDPYIQKESEMAYFENRKEIKKDLQKISQLLFSTLIENKEL